MRDELFGFLIAGHETTGTVIKWVLKWLTERQDVQSKLRVELLAMFPEIREAKQTQSAEALSNTKVCLSSSLNISAFC